MVRDLGYRWGSCGRNGTLYFNWRVLQLPVSVIDYVVVHELCHLVEPNHGLAFWSALERALPDWRDRKDDLHRRARDIYWCIP
jgi:predicted metal-dependent hydrolase